jgi:hypothetical protein
MPSTRSRRRQSRAATLLEVGPGLGACAGVLIAAQHAQTRRRTALHCNAHAMPPCFDQAANHVFQTFAIAAGIGAVIGLVVVTVLLLASRRIIAGLVAALR